MDITWEYETAAADTRADMNRQAREDAAQVEAAWLDFVALFPVSREDMPSVEVSTEVTRVARSSGVVCMVAPLVVATTVSPRPSFFRRLFTLGV